MGLLDLLTPESCLACGETGCEGLCPACKKKLDALFDPHAFRCSGGNGYADGMFTLFHYDIFLPRYLILDLKANGYRDTLSVFRDYVGRAAKHADFPGECDLVTYCPRSLLALGARGFDQAQLLSQEVATVLERPTERLLARSGFVRTQHKLRPDRRFENVKDSFYGTRDLTGENILLIDDVVTTGATSIEAARVLKHMGAMRVFVLCLAH